MTLREDRRDGRAPLSAYLNNSTIRGAILIALGLFALALPRASHVILGIAVAVVLVVFGGTDIKAGWRAKPKHWIGMLIGALY
ncbi:MAG: DUF308 domain-containing protein, partial [Actinomycetota bacterium]